MSSDKPSGGGGKRARIDAAGAPPSADEAPAWALTLQADTIARIASQVDTARAATQVQMDALAMQLSQVVSQVAVLVAPSSEPPQRSALIAHYVRYGELVDLDKRTLLSPAEEVLAIPYLSQRSVMSFLYEEDVLGLRAASRACKDAVAEHAWGDFFSDTSVIKGSLASWRRCFPHATAAHLEGHKTVQDADLVHLHGVHKVCIDGCKQITTQGWLTCMASACCT